MKVSAKILILFSILLGLFSCESKKTKVENKSSKMSLSAKDILGNSNYKAISYGGYRMRSRDEQPTIDQLKEDMRILAAMDVKIIRTYNVHFAHAENVLKAIDLLKKEDSNFEMYVMLGAWINCANAFTDHPNHEGEDLEANEKEIRKAVDLANQYPDIVKVIAVGNEAMVKWAASYFVQPWVILKYVNQLQDLKAAGSLSKDLWITSSDNFASWGGGGEEYQVEDLTKLYTAVDYISIHTYPMHDTHYNPAFWGVSDNLENASKEKQISYAMTASMDYAVSQFKSVEAYMKSLGISKPIHIGETGWASASNGFYGNEGSKATDEYKEASYYRNISDWCIANKVSCFYFEAFDEIWKDAQNPGGSENHFGLITVDGKAKYALWDLVDEGKFEGLGRNGQAITKTFDGNKEKLLEVVQLPPVKNLVPIQ